MLRLVAAVGAAGGAERAAALLRLQAHEPPAGSPDGAWLAATATALAAAARPAGHGFSEGDLRRLLCITHRNTHTLYAAAGRAAAANDGKAAAAAAAAETVASDAREGGESGADEARAVGTALYLAGSLFNHACRPNAAFSNAARVLEVRTLREVAEGEEVTVSYIAAEGRPLGLRRRLLLEQFCFVCECAHCLEEEAREEPQA